MKKAHIKGCPANPILAAPLNQVLRLSTYLHYLGAEWAGSDAWQHIAVIPLQFGGDIVEGRACAIFSLS